MLNLNHLMGRPWAITGELAEHVRRMAQEPGQIAALRQVAELHAKMEAATRTAAKRGGAVAVIPVLGPMTQRGGGGLSVDYVSTEAVADAVRAAAAEPGIQSIVLEFDSPGGEVYGIPEAAAVIREARASKPVVAVANSMAASAAYWLASQADEVLVTPSGDVGSIGVYTLHQDVSKSDEAAGIKTTLISAGKYKVEANPYQPLGEEALAAIQGDVDRAYAMFTQDVAKGRRVGIDAVRGGFGQGRLVGAKAAVEQGMADGIGTVEDAIRRAASLGQERRSAAAARAGAQAMAMRRERGE